MSKNDLRLYDLYRYIESRLEPQFDDLPPSEDILFELNNAHRYVCSEMRIPLRLEENRPANVAFALPDDAKKVLAVWRESDGCQLWNYNDVMKLAADQPQWNNAALQLPAFFGPNNIPDATMAALGLKDTDTLRILWLGEPTDMKDENDVPYDGMYAEHGYAVAYRYLAEHFLTFGTNERHDMLAAIYRNKTEKALLRMWADMDYPRYIASYGTNLPQYRIG